MKDLAHRICSSKKVDSTLELLRRSSFRSKFKLTGQDRQYIQDKGIETIKDHAFDFINSRIASQFPKNDGKQTPMKGHPVFIAQHATATCCRGCLQKWHRIQKGGVLSDNEAGFIVSLIMGWIEKQIGGGENEFIKQQ
ncbi:MAG: DUF4186 domain-containing protein [Thermodesulfobacteriota bacterium]|nr:DUF4186 domain-containing protein [Thermodesulfobacteriota bacterium]